MFDLTIFAQPSEAANDLVIERDALGNPDAFDRLADELEAEPTDEPMRLLIITELRIRAEHMREFTTWR